MATDRGTAVLLDGRWTVLSDEEAHAVTIADDGAIWVGERPAEGTQTTVASFSFDGRAWVRNALPAVATLGRPTALVTAPTGEQWLLSLGWGSELHRFDGTRWTRGSQLGEYQLGDIVGLALAPNGDLVALASALDRTDWAIARYDGATWTVHRASEGLEQPGGAWGAEAIRDRSGREPLGGRKPRPGPPRRAALELALRGVRLQRPLLRPRWHPVGGRTIGRAAPAGQPPGRARPGHTVAPRREWDRTMQRRGTLRPRAASVTGDG